ncbi:unnamed protein product [Phytophthora fragariaefolia]|uniref:Unnamed protein product n=1 Tax=Phytophthora fragariaefolia TaxID=1490495 RepID=A0A9W6TZ20_9STRA|nr:unnamed protein product [Phytophthora fragariaefolia]
MDNIHPVKSEESQEALVHQVLTCREFPELFFTDYEAATKKTNNAIKTLILLRKDAGAVWDTIIFSDDKKWNLDGPDGFQYYWRDLRTPPRQTKRRQAGVGGSVMVWAAFISQDKSPLVVLTGKQNSDDYIYSVCDGSHTHPSDKVA